MNTIFLRDLVISAASVLPQTSVYVDEIESVFPVDIRVKKITIHDDPIRFIPTEVEYVNYPRLFGESIARCWFRTSILDEITDDYIEALEDFLNSDDVIDELYYSDKPLLVNGIDLVMYPFGDTVGIGKFAN